MSRRFVHCRLPCEVAGSGQTTRGIAVNVSENGLFVQTRSPLPAGARVDVRLLSTSDRAEIALVARVARVKKVHPSAQAVVARGMGLEVLEAAEDWRELTRALGCRPAAGDAADAGPGDPSFGLPRFRAVLRSKDGIRIRTRVVRIACVDEAAARSGVAADLEEGWEIVKIERESLRAGAAAPARPFRVVALREGGSLRWEARFDAPSAVEARAAAAGELGAGWRIEAVDPIDDAPDHGASEAAGPPATADEYRVKARQADGARIRTRVVKLRAGSAEEAVERVLAHLGLEWQIERVSRAS